MRIAIEAERHARDDEAVAHEPVEYLEIRSWALNSATRDGHTVSSAVETARESWRTPANAGRVTERRPRLAAGRGAGLINPEQLVQTEDHPAGAYPARWADRPPTDVARLAWWLQRGQPDTDLAPAIVDLLRERVLTPRERAAVLRLLAKIPGVTYRGPVTVRGNDPVHGEAFSLVSDSSGLPTQYSFIVNPLTGEFLASDRMLTRTAGQLNVRIPAVVGYDTFLVAGHVAEIGARGEGG